MEFTNVHLPSQAYAFDIAVTCLASAFCVVVVVWTLWKVAAPCLEWLPVHTVLDHGKPTNEGETPTDRKTSTVEPASGSTERHTVLFGDVDDLGTGGNSGGIRLELPLRQTTLIGLQPRLPENFYKKGPVAQPAQKASSSSAKLVRASSILMDDLIQQFSYETWEIGDQTIGSACSSELEIVELGAMFAGIESYTGAVIDPDDYAA